jgi:sugar/nucleoside kinase (ribokinase family)
LTAPGAAAPDLVALSNLPWDSYFPAGASPGLGAEARTHVAGDDRVAAWLSTPARAGLEAEGVGGSPTNAALAFLGLGGRVRIVGPVARDAWGDRVRGELAEAGAVLLELDPPPPRQAHSLAFREAGGERRFLATLPEVPSGARLPAVDWAGPGWIVASSYEFRNPRFGALVGEAFAAARAAGRRGALDLADPHAVRERRADIAALLAAGLDLVLGATDALAALLSLDAAGSAWSAGADPLPGTARSAGPDPSPGTRPPLPAARLRELAPIVIETRGAAGARLVTTDVDQSVAAAECDVVDTTGAGDALLGALLFALARGDTPIAALRLGQSVAAECVRHVGAHVPRDILARLGG